MLQSRRGMVAVVLGLGPWVMQAGSAPMPEASPTLVRVPSPREGILVMVLIRDGQHVKEGEVLARLDDRLARIDVTIARGRVEAAEAEVAAAEATAQESKKHLDTLMETRRRVPAAISDDEFRMAKLRLVRAMSEEKVKRALLSQARGELQKAELILGLHDVRSPVKGTIKTITHQAGEGVRALETVPVIQIDDSAR
jgi:HlyD family secretion protein